MNETATRGCRGCIRLRGEKAANAGAGALGNKTEKLRCHHRKKTDKNLELPIKSSSHRHTRPFLLVLSSNDQQDPKPDSFSELNLSYGPQAGLRVLLVKLPCFAPGTCTAPPSPTNAFFCHLGLQYKIQHSLEPIDTPVDPFTQSASATGSATDSEAGNGMIMIELQVQPDSAEVEKSSSCPSPRLD